MIVAALVIVLALVRAPRSKRGSRTSEVQPSFQEEETQWAYSPRQTFFTRSEAAFFHAVRKTIPSDHHVFPKVRLSDLVVINATGREYMSAFGRVSQKHVDFVLCDSSFKPYLAVEIDGASHSRQRQQVADETKNRVLDVSGLPIVRYAVGTNWDLGKIAAYVPR